MQSYYAFYGSPLHLLLEDDLATAYNRRVEQFMDAQKRYKEEHGIPWTPDHPLLMQVDEEAQNAFNKVGRVINLLGEINGGGLEMPEEDMPSDTPLVKL